MKKYEDIIIKFGLIPLIVDLVICILFVISVKLHIGTIDSGIISGMIMIVMLNGTICIGILGLDSHMKKSFSEFDNKVNSEVEKILHYVENYNYGRYLSACTNEDLIVAIIQKLSVHGFITFKVERESDSSLTMLFLIKKEFINTAVNDEMIDEMVKNLHHEETESKKYDFI